RICDNIYYHTFFVETINRCSVFKKSKTEKLLTILDSLIKDRKRKRGRPPLYRESLIYFALAVKQIFKLSWRDLEYHLNFILKDEKIPDFTTIFYRANKVDKEVLKKSINYIAVEIISKIGEIEKLIVDGTGFGYNESYYQTWERGKRLKEIKSHIKTQVIIGVKGNIIIPIAVETGKQLFGKIKNAYGDRDNTKNYNLASVFVLIRFLVYNIVVLLAILLYVFLFFKHTNI
ncbi:transposase, partial [Nocardia mangyaensis]|uniref:transposase n=1 Tax=Nocardia mangyaensis TaxID=2213200 RepID=UPI002674B7FD